MSKEKQIEEMANITKAHCELDNQCGSCHWETCNECLAESLYNAGYRKQKEGRWVHNEDRNAYEAEYFCSECLADGNNQGDEPFCWNCGAKMNGGAE